MTDEFVDQVHKKIRDKQNTVGGQAGNLSTALKIVWVVVIVLGIYLITIQKPENDHTLAIIIGMIVISWIILKTSRNSKLSDFELRCCLISQLKLLQQHPVGDYPAIPPSAKLWVTLLSTTRVGMSGNTVKEYGIKWEEPDTGEVFEGSASVNILDGNMENDLPHPLSFDPRERKQIKYVATEDLKKASIGHKMWTGKI